MDDPKTRFKRFEKWFLQHDKEIEALLENKATTRHRAITEGLVAALHYAFHMGFLCGKGLPEDTETYSCAVQDLSNAAGELLHGIFCIDDDDWEWLLTEHGWEPAKLYDSILEDEEN